MSNLANFRNQRWLLSVHTLPILLLILAVGCSSQESPPTTPPTNAPDLKVVAEQIRSIAESGTLSTLRWPDFSDYVRPVQQFYEADNYSPVWIRDGQCTPQAVAMIAALEGSQHKGLDSEDYDATRWPSRLAALKVASADPTTVATFDVALTVSAMRYISDLHIGRLNPKHAEFSVGSAPDTNDLSQFLARKIVAANNVSDALNALEPQYYGYQRAEAALQTYLSLAAKDVRALLPVAEKPVRPSDAYGGVEQLAERLRLCGDLAPSVAIDTAGGIYGGALVDAIKHFQIRHGIAPNGTIGEETFRQLNTPLSIRVTQLEDALERWRWLPQDFTTLPVAVNIPEFVLRVFSPDHRVAMRMNVVVGKAFGHQTPVFAQEMKYIVFRPYWNVPPSIVRSEIAPALQKSATYLARKHLEITDRSGHVITNSTVSSEILAELRSSKLMVRQRPGPDNSLGLVKFIFPNEYNVYLHSTPAPQLFSQSRRDFSHGCIRVQKPAELAAFLLQDQPKWTLENIKAAMDSGPDNQQVNLLKPVPVVIVYMTAVVEEDGEVYFFDDIYGHDRSLNAALAKRRPYAR
jgi:murein L,D-transpeptidase YcbB/YkuD